jgi:hypothetical protein
LNAVNDQGQLAGGIAKCNGVISHQMFGFNSQIEALKKKAG